MNMSNPPKTTQAEVVYVVDDDEAVRDSLTWLLESNGYTVRCHASAERFLQSLQNTDKSTISCLILDVRMPGMSGLELQERLISENLPMPISFITGHGDVSMAVSTMKRGAVDFIEKPFKENELCALVERMLTKARVDFAQADQRKNTQSLLSKLTGRERQVLERIVAGRLNKQIADDLSISIKTVEAHRANIMEKLNVNTVADLLRLALS
ncbi:MAG: response regulator transcription factor [Polynucleobacter sp.]|jgi:FixJ family two-component response regulator|uniref:response regulator transcription factor n=1 Tax=unclassified Polynucleobacter TaxID=2640945 RepID=UPI001BFEDB5F|nr:MULTISPECIES: response regulator transcription factor [unclassified Polynucleobacter]MBM3348088.1 response regulator transcription factor [Betaproteobacteria bacterium]MBU3725967.1 response regulator transcription factor [Polynucleobacter sp.]NBO85531.1 DNA-binding response regulator [Burkholderiaceae bacterium]NCU93112.1 DNA-binding response regulator [Burkholderiaceae bacterium]NCV03947.1 DNA-binding response regulator [Burkholderiaceae bacterium]